MRVARARAYYVNDWFALGLFVVLFFVSAGVAALWVRLAVAIYGVLP